MRAAEVWNRVVPWRQRQRVTDARVAVRRRLDAHRVLPAFLIIGAQRGGTSSLYKWLETHPDTGPSLRKEVEYFSYRFSRGPAWYRAHFPSRARRTLQARRGRPLLPYEASPYYLAHPLAAARAAEVVGDARLVVLLRDPVERAISHHAHMVSMGLETLGLTDALDAEPGRLAGEVERMIQDPSYDSRAHRNFSYVTRGLYAEQLERWLAVYPREQLLVLQSEELYRGPRQTFEAVLQFVGLEPVVPSSFGNFSAGGGMNAGARGDDAVRARLRAEFASANRRLYDLLGQDLGWDHPA